MQETVLYRLFGTPGSNSKTIFWGANPAVQIATGKDTPTQAVTYPFSTPPIVYTAVAVDVSVRQARPRS